MKAWILNRLIACCLDNAAVLETAGAMLPDGMLAAKLRCLAAESAANAHDLAQLLFQVEGQPDLTGTGSGAARCRGIVQAALLGDALRTRALEACLKSVGDGLAVCEGLATFSLPPPVSSAIEVVCADFRMHRFELAHLLDGTPNPAPAAGPKPEPARPKRILRWDGKDGRLLDP